MTLRLNGSYFKTGTDEWQATYLQKKSRFVLLLDPCCSRQKLTPFESVDAWNIMLQFPGAGEYPTRNNPSLQQSF
jgi:hypothetical protein